MLFWHLACRQNPHIRQVNCGFSVCESLKIPLFIRFQGGGCELFIFGGGGGWRTFVRYATEDTS